MSAGDGPPSGDDGTGSSADSDAGRTEPDRPDESPRRDDLVGPADAGARDRPSSRAADPGEKNVFRRFRDAEDGPLMFVREVLTSVLAVVAVGVLLFAVSGVWPPMVAVESGSMEPHMSRGDLVFITEPGRYAPDAAVDGTGVVTHETGVETGYRTFGDHGSVIVYDRPDRFGPPVIHRARLHVTEGENWYDRANPEYMDASNCEQLRHCPAPHDGLITKGDANPQYDQVSGIAGPVQERDIAGVARVRVPYLGYVRLGFATATRAEGATDPTAQLSRSSPFTTIVSSRNGGVCPVAEPSTSWPAATHPTGSTASLAAA